MSGQTVPQSDSSGLAEEAKGLGDRGSRNSANLLRTFGRRSATRSLSKEGVATVY